MQMRMCCIRMLKAKLYAILTALISVSEEVTVLLIFSSICIVSFPLAVSA